MYLVSDSLALYNESEGSNIYMAKDYKNIKNSGKLTKAIFQSAVVFRVLNSIVPKVSFLQ